ncbi:hypothetical protein HK098_004953 [Nowakowskiella sp. JEL0407]|nr:hypothetical protein HK098_004953 [Nowakowskiella sp. JEL0407]
MQPRYFTTNTVARHAEVGHKRGLDDENPGPLAGIRVLDLTRILAGPYCTMILGDLGAEIIKVENPDGGDDTRTWGPPFAQNLSADGEIPPQSAYFLGINRNKKSITVNLKSPEGLEIVRRLATISDVLVENYIPGKLDELGLGYTELSKRNPKLVYASITGYGPDGPFAHRAGYDVIIEAEAGMMHITGEPNGTPVKVGVAITDMVTGLYTHGAIMAALFARTKTGMGQKIDASLLESQVSTLANIGHSYLIGGLEGKRWGTSHASIVPYQAFKTKDGYVVFGAGNDKQYKKVITAFGRADLADHEKFRTNQLRVKHREDLVSIIQEILIKENTDHWLKVLEPLNIPFDSNAMGLFDSHGMASTLEQITKELKSLLEEVKPLAEGSSSSEESFNSFEKTQRIQHLLGLLKESRASIAENSNATTSFNPLLSKPFEMTPSDQVIGLKSQFEALNFIRKNEPLPAAISPLVYNPSFTSPSISQEKPDTSTMLQNIVNGSYQQHKANAEFNATSSSVRIAPSITEKANLLHITPNLPLPIDPLTLQEERDRRIEARLSFRIKTLENLNLSTTDILEEEDPETQEFKLKAAIELKALKLAEKQRQLRQSIVQSMQKGTLVATPPNRSMYKKMKKHTLENTFRLLKSTSEFHKSREDRERTKHREYLSLITNHAADMNSSFSNRKSSNVKMGASVLKIHAKLEKEEQMRIQKLRQERLNALKSNDEEAYLKLIDKAKDSRIHHILTQTKQFLGSLMGAVQSQKETIVDDRDDDAEDGEIGGDKDEYYNHSHKIKETVTEQPAMLVGGTLKEYQLKGLEWMVSLYNNKLNGILADEMGLGKTIQTISLITYLIEKKRVKNPFLVVVPLSTLANWVHEFDKWAPSVVKIVFKGNPAERKKLAEKIRAGGFNVLLTTYEFIIREKGVLSRPNWVQLIIDEGHRMKNAHSKLSITLIQHYRCPYRLILTGTPLQNNLPELWALLNFILPKIFNSVKTFDEWFNSPFSSQMGQEKMDLNEEEQLLIIKRLHKVLRPFLLRRLKKDVEAELPDKVETIIKVRMSALQHLLYENSRNKRSFLEGNQRALLQNLMMHFRKICNHPFVCDPVEDHFNLNQVTDTIYRVSGKFEWLDRTLPKFKTTGHRILMFFQMTSVMNVMSDYLNWKGYDFLRLDGAVKAEERGVSMKEFNAPDSKYFIFLLSTRAGGLGLNLQSADTVIIFDSDWNPHQDLQAQDRAHRIGQTKEVRIYRLITVRSIEEHILARAQYKLDMDKKVIQGGKFDQKTSEKEREDLLRSLFANDDDDKKENDEDKEDEELNDDELNEVLARNEEELVIFKEMDRQRKLEEERICAERGLSKPLPRLMSFDELPNSLKYQDQIDINGEARVEMGRGARDRGTVRYRDLKDDEWLQAIERGDDPDDIAREKELQRLERKARKAEKLAKEDSDDDDMDDDIPIADAVQTPKKRGRPPVNPGSTASPRGRGRGRGRGAAVSRLVEDGRKRKRKRSPSGVDYDKEDLLPLPVRAAMVKVCRHIFETVKNLEVDDNQRIRKRSELFLEIPSKKFYPQYYTMIQNPISLMEIEKRFNSAEYDHISHFKDDFKLMFANARIFNLEGSPVFNDANEMERVFDLEWARLCPNDELRPEDIGDEEASVTVRKPMKRRSGIESDDEETETQPSGFVPPVKKNSLDGLAALGLPFAMGRQNLPSIKLKTSVDVNAGFQSDGFSSGFVDHEDGEILE